MVYIHKQFETKCETRFSEESVSPDWLVVSAMNYLFDTATSFIYTYYTSR